jgi:uncharacterized lipoprotein YmbA
MKLFLLVIVLLLGGCASAGSVPELQRYLLRSDSTVLDPSPALAPTIGIGSLTVASYIDQVGIVVELPGGAVRAANHHQWAEPLRESLRGLMADEIGSRAAMTIRHQSYGSNAWKSSTPRLIHIHINTLHGSANGEAILAATWTLEDRISNSISERHFEIREPLRGEGYGALVAAEKRALQAFAASIAEQL